MATIDDLMNIHPKDLTPSQSRAVKDFLDKQQKLDVWESVLANEIKKKNVFTLSEFKKYEILYKKNDYKKMAIENLDEIKRIGELGTEFYNRIDPYSEVTVVDDADPDKVLYTLPRQYTQFSELKAGTESALIEYGRLTNIDFRQDLKEEGMNKLLGAIAVSQNKLLNPELRKKEQDRYVELERSVMESQDETEDTSSNDIDENTQTTNTTATWDYDDD